MAKPSPLPVTSPEPRHSVRDRVLARIAQHPVCRMIGPARVARWAGLDPLWQAYAGLDTGAADFEKRLLAALDIGWRIGEGTSATIPRQGGLLVVGNHPTGGAEGLIAQALIGTVRDDWMVLGNRTIALLPELAHRQIGVSRGQAEGIAMVAAARHLREGGALLMFPAGTVAHWQPGRGYAEAPWHPSAAGLARLSCAVVQPLCFTARTTLRWKVLSAMSRTARTALLPRELLAQRGRTIILDIPAPILDTKSIDNWFQTGPLQRWAQ